jgi:hypothetical protein
LCRLARQRRIASALASRRLAQCGQSKAKQSKNRSGNPFRVLLLLLDGHFVKPRHKLIDKLLRGFYVHGCGFYHIM